MGKKKNRNDSYQFGARGSSISIRFRQGRENFPLHPFHPGGFGLFFMIMAHQMYDSMHQEAGDFLHFRIRLLTDPFMHDIQTDDHVPQRQRHLVRRAPVPLDFLGRGARKRKDVGGFVLSAPLAVQLMDEGIVDPIFLDRDAPPEGASPATGCRGTCPGSRIIRAVNSPDPSR